MSYAIFQHERPLSTNDHLRREFGWLDVRSGLGRILFGYLILIGGTIVAGGLVAAAVIHVIKTGMAHPGQAPKKLDLSFLWLFYLGLGLMSLVSLFGYGSIIIGYWRCLVNVPERHGARWLLFTSMTCLLMGPAINIVASFSMEKGLELRKGPEGFAHVEFTPFAKKLQLAGALTSMMSLVCFMLFLRAIALSFDDHFRAAHVLVYLFVLGLLLTGTVYLYLGRLPPARMFAVVIGLGLGLAVTFLWYLYLIGSMRRCISYGLSQVKSPLEFEPPSSATSYGNYY